MKRFLCTLALTFFFALNLQASVAYSQDDRDRMIRLETRVDEMTKRFDERFEQVDKRFEQVDKRFEQIQNQINNTNQIMLGLMGGIFAMIGFMWWDRRTILRQAKEEMRTEVEIALSKKADAAKLVKIFDILAELAQEDPTIRKAMEKHHLKLV